MVNFKGILPPQVHDVWNVKVPPNIHFFFWLLAHNKLLTRDNLSKRQHVDDMSSVFCSESESCSHVFFTCNVAAEVWRELNRIMNKPYIPMSFDKVVGLWVSNKKDCIKNSVYAAILCVPWRTINDTHFNKSPYLDYRFIWRKTTCMLSQWRVLLSGDALKRQNDVIERMEHLARAQPLLLWPDLVESQEIDRSGPTSRAWIDPGEG
jgi:hypothetical protein